MSKDSSPDKIDKLLIWEGRFSTWTASGKATKVEDPILIKDLIMILKYWVDNDKRVGFFGNGGANPLIIQNELTEDGISAPIELINRVMLQIDEHKKLWETAGKKVNLPAFETGFWIEEKQFFKYFKFQITADGSTWRQPKKVKKLDINYHKNSKEQGIEIEIKTK